MSRISWSVTTPGDTKAEATRVLGTFLAAVMKRNLVSKNFRLFGPDETASNRLGAVIDVTGKAWMAETQAVDIDLSVDGRVMEALSEHLCEGWLEGYLLTGRQWLDIDSAEKHCRVGAGVWQWASNDVGEPDVVMACAGEVPTLEILAAVTLLRQYVPDIRIRVVNVVGLMTLQPESEHPHGLTDEVFDALFTRDRPIIFAFHGYPGLIHRLTYRRHNHGNLHVRGCNEEGTTTTPFDMVVLNHMDRYQLALDAIGRVPRLQHVLGAATQRYRDTIRQHKTHISEHGEDMPEVLNWRWT